MAIVREESAFNPLLESYANAVGLTQMIFPTARRFARGTYSKRVLASYFVYSYLYRDTIPTISNEIPEGLIPGKK